MTNSVGDEIVEYAIHYHHGPLFINKISSRDVVHIVVGGGGPNVAVKYVPGVLIYQQD